MSRAAASSTTCRRTIAHALDSVSGLDSPAVRLESPSSYLFPIAAGSRPEPSLTPEAAMGSLHQPVLVNEIVAWLTPHEGAGSIIVDGTVGGGGHTVALARRLGAGGRLVGLDRDPAMLDLAEQAVKGAGSPLPVTLVHAAYREMRRVLDELGIDRVQGVLLDLGLSSDQLAWEGRGFSFSTDGPLDMRFDPE